MTEFNFTLDGQVLHLSFHKLDSITLATLKLCIVNGLAIGCGALLMILSWLTITNRKTPMFALNQFTLLCMVLRSALYVAFLLGPVNSLEYKYTGILGSAWNSYHVSVATDSMHTLLVASVEATLVFQIYVVFRTSSARHLGYVFTGLFAALGICIVGLYINSTAIAAGQLRDQLEIRRFTASNSWVNNVPVIMFSASMNVICAILIFKLVSAIRTRRHLGLKQFDAFHILIIMATQTMLIPSVLMIVNYHQLSSYSSLLANISIVLAVLNLPFSSVWASSANNSRTPCSSYNTVFFKASPRQSELDTLAEPQSPLTKFGNLVVNSDVMSANTNVDSDRDSIDRYINSSADVMTTKVLKNVV